MPLLTMRVFSEEKKTGSIELLLTYPISDWAVVLGKFGAIKMMILAILVSTVPSILLLFGITSPDIGSIITGYLGLILLGASLGALGIFISSLTENQIVAAAITFAAVLFFKILSWGAALADETVGSFLKHLSISEHLDSFNKGIISLPDLSYFILFTVFFLFMTLRSLETYRWRG
jgi:ABC-2 type transport system permease protein